MYQHGHPCRRESREEVVNAARPVGEQWRHWYLLKTLEDGNHVAGSRRAANSNVTACHTGVVTVNIELASCIRLLSHFLI